jgi:hypothetical protein
MVRIIAAVTGLFALTAIPCSVLGADLSVLHGGSTHSCRSVWRCGPSGCGWHRDCWHGCPAGSCFPLYGAYGPYGGEAYWSAFSYNDWDDYAPLSK